MARVGPRIRARLGSAGRSVARGRPLLGEGPQLAATGSCPALHERDNDPAGFAWTEPNDASSSLLSLLRFAKDGSPVLVVCNFTPVPRHDLAARVPSGGYWRELLNSDATEYGRKRRGQSRWCRGAPDARPVDAVVALVDRAPARLPVPRPQVTPQARRGARRRRQHQVRRLGARASPRAGPPLGSGPLVDLEPGPDGYHSATARCGPGTRYRYVLDSGRQCADPASRAQPDGVHGPSQVVDLSSHVWHDSDYKARPLVGPGDLRGPYRHLHAGGHIRGRLPRAGRPRRSSGWAPSSSCRWPSSRAGATGVTTASSPSPSGLLRRAGRTAALRRCLPRTGPGRHPRRRLQPPRPRGQRARCTTGRTSPTATARHGARRSTSTGRDSDEVRAYFIAERPAVVRGLPHRRPAPRRRARDHRPQRHDLPRPNWPREAADSASRRARPAGSSPRARTTTRASSPRERPEASASTRSGTTTSTMPCTPPSPARTRATTSTSAAWSDLARAMSDGLRLPGRALEVPKRVATGRPPRRWHPERFVIFAQNHDHIGNRPQGRPPVHDWSRRNRPDSSPRCVLLSPGSPPAVHGRGVRRDARRSPTSSTTATPSSWRRCGQAGPTEFASLAEHGQLSTRPHESTFAAAHIDRSCVRRRDRTGACSSCTAT